jgi:hypothetical protein
MLTLRALPAGRLAALGATTNFRAATLVIVIVVAHVDQPEHVVVDEVRPEAADDHIHSGSLRADYFHSICRQD